MEGTLLTLSILCGLATWRLTSLLHTEDAFEWLRKWIGIENNEEDYPTIYPLTFWGGLFSCFWCLSLVTALPITVCIVSIGGVPWPLAPFFWMASSAIAVWLEKQIMHSHSR